MREGPVAATASSTQSSMRRPSRRWRCFGVSERMRVPRPPAMTRAARFGSLIARGAGAPGFEPGIAGPKPAALPLGYAPQIVGYRPRKFATARLASVRRRAGKPSRLDGRRRKRRLSTWLRPKVGSGSLAPPGNEHDQDDSRENTDTDQGERADDQHEHGNHRDDRLRDRARPERVAREAGTQSLRESEVRDDHEAGHEQRRQDVDDVEDDEHALDERDPERDPEPVRAEPATVAGRTVLQDWGLVGHASTVPSRHGYPGPPEPPQDPGRTVGG